jgi:hypothetical protein
MGNLILWFWRWQRRGFRIRFGGKLLEFGWRDLVELLAAVAVLYAAMFAVFSIPE